MSTGSDPRRSPESVDRLMVGACGAIWVMLLVVAVIATVALVNLGRVDHGEAQSPWVLYTVIVVSALTILGAVPLLLRARRDAIAGHAEPAPAGTAVPVPTPGVAAERVRVFGTTVDPRGTAGAVAAVPGGDSAVAPAVARVMLRGAMSILGAMGLALTSVAAATSLLATGRETGAIVALGIAGGFTLGMIATFVLSQRALTEATR